MRHFTCTCLGPKHGAATGCSGTGTGSEGDRLCAWCVEECRVYQVVRGVADRQGQISRRATIRIKAHLAEAKLRGGPAKWRAPITEDEEQS